MKGRGGAGPHPAAESRPDVAAGLRGGGPGGAAGTRCGLHPWAGPNCGLRVGPMPRHNRPSRSGGTATP